MRFFYCFFVLLLAPALRAQIAAPDFTCTRSEAGAVTLNWNNPAPENCGAFEATEIYRATDLNGPFTLLAEITDPAATDFTDPNPAGQLRYYFLRYRYACPGQAVMNSDTLDSFIPAIPVVQFVGIEDNEVVIDWLASVSPEVTGYIILEVTDVAFVPLDTVYGVTDYRLAFGPGDPAPETRSFRLVAIDPCGNDSPQGTIVSAAGLTGSGGAGCTSDITLFPATEDVADFLPSVSLELFVSVNNGPFTPAGTFPPNAAEISYREANDGETLCFYFEAVLANDFGRARSAVFCQTVMITQPLRDFPLYGVEISDAGELLFQYGDDALQPTPAEAELLVSRLGGQLETGPLPTPVFGSGGQLTFPALTEEIAPGETLRFRLTDACNREVNTNEVAPVRLTVREIFPGQNQLSWSPLVNGLEGTITYDVFRADAGTVLVPLASDLAALSFVDDFLAAGGEVCYKVRARFRPVGAAATETFVFSSNTACVTPVPELFLPNVFSPVAQRPDNRTFRPFFSSLPAAEGYQLQVFNRWGGVVFLTTDPAAGWDGTGQDGQPAASGTYLYTLRYTATEGQIRERAGTVNLLR